MNGDITQKLSFWGRVKLQLLKHIENIKEENRIQNSFKRYLKKEQVYLMKDDKDLTQEQLQAIDQFWRRYQFAYPKINYDEFKAYMNRTGVFDPRYIPSSIRTLYIAPYLQHEHYYWSEQNKTLLDKIFPNIKQPDVIVRRINSYFYDGDYNRIDLSSAVNICLEYLDNGKQLIWKPNDISGGGRGIKFFKTATEEELNRFFMTGANSFVIQNVMKQHADMAKLNPYAVNTLRITSIIWKNEVVILAAAVRIGNSEKQVDNWNAGGMIVGVNKEVGSVYPWGLDKKCIRYSKTIGGVDLSLGYQIPSWNQVLELIQKAHWNIPYIKLASWDIAIDEAGEPTLIEVNFAGDWHIHQLTTGPMLDGLTQEVLDKAILEKHHKKHSTLNFDFKEFHKHVVVEKYIGKSQKVKIPQTMYGKPVTVIGKRAFRFNKNIEHVILPPTIKVVGERAFSGCVSLTEINIPTKCVVHKTAFIDCPVKKNKRLD